MSLIKTGFGISAISGKNGGTIYSRNRGGPYSKAWVDPTNPETPDQIDKWQIWTDSADLWNTLTREQVDQWRDYADRMKRQNRLGQPITLTAQTTFTELYTNAALIGSTPLTEPTELTNRPAVTNPGFIQADISGTELGRLVLRDTEAITPSGDTPQILLYAAPCLRPTIRNVNNQFRLITSCAQTDLPLDYLDAFKVKFPIEVQTGWLAHARLRIIDPVSFLGSTRVLIDATIN